MNLTTLLLHLENQLKWVSKQRSNYLNVETLSHVQLQKLIDGLQQVVTRSPEEEDEELEEDAVTVSSEHEGDTCVVNSPQSRLSEIKRKLAAKTSQNVPPFDFSQEAKSPILDQASPKISFKHSSPTPIEKQTKELSADPAQVETLESLREHYCDCKRCPLGETRTNFVFGTGHPNPSLMFIGEGPGQDEDQMGMPFVGPAGKLLTKMINVIGIDRPDVYIANVVKCRPPGNRNPEPSEIANCFPLLQRQIELLNPTLIVTLGNVPTRTLIPDALGITKVRGKVFKYQKWTVIPTFHPSYLLRSPSAMEAVWEDLKKITSIAFKKQ